MLTSRIFSFSFSWSLFCKSRLKWGPQYHYKKESIKYLFKFFSCVKQHLIEEISAFFFYSYWFCLSVVAAVAKLEENNFCFF